MNHTSTTGRLLVTGAAAGIGLATARLARAAGWRVAGIDRDTPAQDDLLEAAIRCDVADEEAVVAAFTELDAVWPDGPTAVAHCAGIYHVEPSAQASLASWERVAGINARGSFLVARESGRRMLAHPGGDRAIVLLSSIGAVRGDRHEPSAAYSASKGAINSLTRQLAAEWGGHGVRVNAVAPGVIETAMTTVTDDPEASEAFFGSRVPLGRIGTADEVASACLYLASPAASYVSGAVLAVDGGMGVA